MPFGVLVDRVPKKWIMVMSNIIRFFLILSIPLFPFMMTNLWLLFMISFVIFTISQVFIPAETSSIPLVTDKEDLLSANSLFMGTWMIASVLGFGVAVPIAMVSKELTFYVCGALYLSASFLLLMVKITNERLKKSPMINVKRELVAGWRFVMKHRIVFWSLSQMFFAISVLAIISVVAVGYTHDILKLPEAEFGLIVAVAGIGMGAGILSMLSIFKNFRKQDIILNGFILMIISIPSLSFIEDVYYAFAAAFFLGVSNAFITAPNQTLIQERTPSALRGRVFSVQTMLSSFAFTFPPILAGLLADLKGYPFVFIMIAVFAMLFNMNNFKHLGKRFSR
jgi:MFS family permease